MAGGVPAGGYVAEIGNVSGAKVFSNANRRDHVRRREIIPLEQ